MAIRNLCDIAVLAAGQLLGVREYPWRARNQPSAETREPPGMEPEDAAVPRPSLAKASTRLLIETSKHSRVAIAVPEPRNKRWHSTSRPSWRSQKRDHQSKRRVLLA